MNKTRKGIIHIIIIIMILKLNFKIKTSFLVLPIELVMDEVVVAPKKKKVS